MGSNHYERRNSDFLTLIGADPLAKFTIWVRADEGRTHVGVYDASNADGAMQRAFEAVAQAWSCDQNALSIAGIVEGELPTANGDESCH
jgi:hypothetical protein